MKGIFITFEGGEGAGKTTLIESIIEELKRKGRKVVKTREPGGTELGEEIRKILLHGGAISPYAELALFLASRAQHVQQLIRPALEEGKVVLCDRFNDSSIAYQGVARGLGFEEVGDVCSFFSEGLVPDLTLYLDLAPEVGLERASRARVQDRIESETLSFHQKIREGYLAIHQKDPRRLHLVNATLPPKEVFQQAMESIHALLQKTSA